MNKIYFIYDVGPQSRLQWLASAFSGKEVNWVAMKYNPKNRVYRWRKPLHFLGYFEVAIRSIRTSGKGDCLVSWNFIIGAFIGVLCHLFRIDRTILSLNMISHNKQGLISFIRKTVYNYAFSYKKFYFTVNSEDTLHRYLEEYKIRKEQVSVLPDAYLPGYKEENFRYESSYVFCGGEAQRDWEVFFAAASQLPEHKFVGVGRKKYMPKQVHLPTNVQMYYDIEESDFDELLKNSSIVALPLKSKMPAGLIVMFKAIFLSIPIITTQTSSIENYLKDGVSAVLTEIGDVEKLKNAIKKLYSDRDWGCTLTKNAKTAIEKHSPEAYSQAIYNILFERN
ncbi:glycosyltransferase [Dysgonomonas sp. 520]|uniref:glycosyltransferase n=1 Tax=Dysgonomonas sp. 520 TaxID=2302931 RepID=UPI0013D1F180|nr:glycosyltransferase [Dysgonomonas sp. 520]NDW10590.1 glycosyltransferase family 1 protein [Dysgonomonas sp. 520]